MTVPFVRRSGSINYIRINNGIPCVYTGASGNTPIPQYTVCQTEAITSDFAITFIDEAHPLYVIGSGNIGGMWGPDIYYYNEHIDPNFPSCAHILFDVDTPFVARGEYQGNPITEDPFYVYPTGVNTTSPVGCELPMQELNIVQISRPSGGIESNFVTAIGTISQLDFSNDIIGGIETVWGSGFWDRMANSNNKLWIIRANKKSLGTEVIQSGVDLFKDYLTSLSIDYTEHFPTCNDTDRYLGWLTDCITYGGTNVSCTGMFIPPNITQDNIQGSGSHSTGKLVTMTLEGYPASSGDAATYNATIDIAIDSTTQWLDNGSPIGWPAPNGAGKYLIATYSEYDVEAGSPLTYYYSAYLYYENGLHKIELDVYCYVPPSYQFGDAGRNTWVCILPLDQYGLPNGPVQPGELTISAFENICTPRFPNIVFTSHPSGQPIAPGTDCTQFNP